MNTEEFALQPTLTGPTTLIRPLRSDDWHAMFAAASDPEIWALHPAKDRYKEDVFREFFDAALNSGSAFALIDLSSNTIIGSSRFHGLDRDKSEIEIGWTFLARSHWGGDTNREIKHLMLNHAFQYVQTVVFWVGEENLRSRRAMEKIGGVLKPGIVYRTLSGEIPHVIYEVTKTQFHNSATH